MTTSIYNITKKGERKNIEFKERLNKDYHLQKDRKHRLASQMKYRMERGDGEAIYFIGVDDDGNLIGLDEKEIEESLFVLKNVTEEVNALILKVEKYPGDNGEIARVFISKNNGFKRDHMLVGVAGHVDHGKSTLVGTLTTGNLDNGSGRTRIFLDLQKHEIERGLSADLSFAIYGFCNDDAMRIKNPLNKKDKAKLVEDCDKLICFVDTVGHEPWLRTTIRGIVGQKLDYGLLTIAADQGPTHITREHLGIMLAMELPVMVAITKTDIVNAEKLKENKEKVFELLKLVGKVPFMIKRREDAQFVAQNDNPHLVPIINVSSLTGEGLELFDELFLNLNIKDKVEESLKPFMMYIDKIYSVVGAGAVVSGTIRQGKINKGDKLLLGPAGSGKYMNVRAKSIEMHYCKKDYAEAGDVVGISIKGVDINDIKRGMILCDHNYDKSSIREFEADVAILVHPTTIKEGYECITHIETISETVAFEPLDKEYLSAGDSGKVRMRFKYRPYCVKEGQKIIFREGRSKGIGSVTRVIG